MPSGELTFTPASLIAIADDEMQNEIVPLILRQRAKHFRAFKDTITEALESGAPRTRYPIPEYAMNRRLQNVAFVEGKEERSLHKIDHDLEMDVPIRGNSWTSWMDDFLGGRQGYYISGDELVLYPSASAGRTLRMYYYRLPNRLVATTDAARVISVNPLTGTLTCSAVPTAWAPGDSVCCVDGKPGFQLKFESRPIVTSSSPTLELADVSLIAPGDWIALEGDSPIPQIPVETHPLLYERCAYKILKDQGDAKSDETLAAYEAAKLGYIASFNTDVEQGPNKIVSRRGIFDYVRRR